MVRYTVDQLNMELAIIEEFERNFKPRAFNKWYKEQRFEHFNNMTPQEMVFANRGQEVLNVLRAFSEGGYI